MTREVEKEGSTYYRCEECNLYYSDEQWAKKCETWCKEHKSCNLDIIEHAADIK